MTDARSDHASTRRRRRPWPTAALGLSLVVAAACPMAAQTPREPGDARLGDGAAASVVQVIATTYGAAPGQGLASVHHLAGAGTAVGQGLLLTAAPLVAGASAVVVRVTPPDGQPHDVAAEIVAIAHDLDVAVLRIPPGVVRPLTLSSRRAREGDLAILPGLEPEVRDAGAVLAAGLPLRNDAPVPYLVTSHRTARLGGPVIDARGALIGLVTVVVPESSADAPAVAAIPVPLLAAVLEDVARPATSRRGIVGLAAESLLIPGTPDGARHDERVLMVSAVRPGLPADQAGVRAGDLIRAVDGAPLDGMDLTTLYVALYTLREGQTLTLDLEREGQHRQVVPRAVAVHPFGTAP